MTERNAPSLDQLRDLVVGNQQRGDTNPVDPAKQVHVSNTGRLHVGPPASGEAQNLSAVPQEVFAGRLEDERIVARTKMPPGTEACEVDGTTGWSYAFTNEFEDEYEMFAYFDGQHYQVLVVRPELEEKWKSQHTGHLFSSGLICFGNEFGSGRKTLQDAYAKSVLWSNGISVARRGYAFPFSANQ